MTKRIKAWKRRRKASRPRLPGVREANGRLSRKPEHVQAREVETEQAVTRTMVEARVRLFGLTEEAARKQEAGTVVGRMLQRKELSADQHAAAVAYLEARNAYHSAIGAKSDTGRHPYPETASAGSHDDFCKVAIERYDAVREALRDLCRDVRSASPIAALDVIVVRDEHAAHLVGDLRMALNALHRHFTSKRKRAA